MGKLLSFNSGRRCAKGAHPQTTEPNQHVRASWVRQFSIGKSTMAIARQNKTRMRIVENEIRMALWERATANSGRAA